MLELARALATKPQLLLIDEPAAGLNAAEVDGLLDRIRTLRNDRTTVILVEHNMGARQSFCRGTLFRSTVTGAAKHL